MPEHVFAGHDRLYYPEARDAAGQPVGEVEPGDTRDLDEPLDHHWLPVTSGVTFQGDEPKAVKRPKAGTGTDTAGEPGSKEN